MKWNSIKKLPKKDSPYIVFIETADKERPLKIIAWYNPSFGWSLIPLPFINSVTHWMELPKNPKKRIL